MSSRRSSRRRKSPTDPLCLEGRSGFDRKEEQLCAQVADALHLILAGCRDPILRELQLEAVVAAPNAARLEALVRAVDPALASEALRRARGYLRSQVSGEIQRKRTPELVFRIVPPTAEGR